MKKIIFILTLSVLMASCGSSKVVRKSKRVIKGSWTLNEVKLQQKGNYNISLFNVADKSCFEGSSWNFIPNNNSGNYAFNNSSCDAMLRNFIFTIKEIDPETGLYDFLLKPINSKKKKENKQGFRLRLSQLSETNMQWQLAVNVGGKIETINMNFIK